MTREMPKLRSLSPVYVPAEHEDYVNILVTALTRTGTDAPRNIALTGHYGSGKSSVLIEVQRRLGEGNIKVVNLSLPSLGVGDGRIPTGGDAALDKTNLIQKEIVKQLLYRRKPSDTPASRYNRLDTFQRKPAIQRAAATAAGLTGLALLAGVPSKVNNAFPSRFWLWLNEHTWPWGAVGLQWLSLLVVFALSLGAVVWAQRLFHQRLRLSELAAGPAKVTLSEQSTSFFDEYLDEIVYFFQNSGTSVVVFEDIDRFKDPHIFEALRELNMLLNNAEQTGEEPIRFVYAIRDSIFEELDHDTNETRSTPGEMRRLMSTNRTKFFDLVVPIVPFISHKTSRDSLRTELSRVEAGQRPSVGVIDLVSVHLTDMRLIKNICNEYDLFRSRILGMDGLEGLTADRLFASIVYKNVYMGDYEAIRVAESAFDDLYRAFRRWVAYRAAASREAERNARAQLMRVSAAAVDRRSKRLGERLQAVLEAKGPQMPHPAHSQLIYSGNSYSWSRLTEPDFWRSYLRDPQDVSIVYRPGYATTELLSFDALQTLMNENLTISDWETEDRAALRTKMAEASVEQRVVMHASLTDALTQVEKRFEYEGAETSLSQVAEGLLEGDGNALARELLQAGYIDENFALYVTQFPGHGSASAMNFILKAVQPDVMDIEYHFGPGDESSGGDIDSVIQAEGPRLLQGRSVYNIEIFDHLLNSEPAKLDEPIYRLSRSADTDREFIEAYLSAGERTSEFVQRLSASWEGVFDFLIGQGSGEQDLNLLNAAILGAEPDTAYTLNDDQRKALVTALPQLPAVATAQNEAEARSVARVFERLGVRPIDMAKVVEPLRGELVARNLYEVSRSNLVIILGNDDQLPLDILKADHDEVYQYMLTHLSEYLSALGQPEAGVTVSDRAHFANILVDVAKTNPAALTDIAAAAADGCLIDDLSAFDSGHWASIARAHRLLPTVPLVVQYLAEVGLDDEMSEFLSTARRFEIADDDGDRLELGMTVINAHAFDDDTKLALLGSLRLTIGSITASAVEAHAHALIPKLVSGGWITDDENAFECLGEDERSTKQALVLASKAFPEYMTSLTLTATDLLDLASPTTPDVVKEVLLREYRTFEPAFGAAGAKALATWLAAKGHRPEARVIVSLATKGKAASVSAIVQLLGAQASTIEFEALRDALNALGDPFDRLTERGRDRPKPPMIEGISAILQRLVSERIVSRITEKPEKSEYEVSKRYR